MNFDVIWCNEDLIAYLNISVFTLTFHTVKAKEDTCCNLIEPALSRIRLIIIFPKKDQELIIIFPKKDQELTI